MKRRKRTEPKPIKEFIQHFENQKKFKQGLIKVKVIEAWREVVGPELSHISIADNFSYGCLVVYTKNATVNAELFLRRNEIITKLNDYLEYNYIEKISFYSKSSLFEK